MSALGGDGKIIPMKKLEGKKIILLLISILGILAVVLLVPGIDSLQLKPEKPFLAAGSEQAGPPSGGIPPFILYFALGIFIVGFIILLRWLSPEQRRRFLWRLLRLLVLIGLAFLIFSRFMASGGIQQPSEATQELPPSQLQETPVPTQPSLPPVIYTPPQVSAWVSYLVTVVILLAGLVIWWIWSRRRRSGDLLMQELAEAAQDAIGELRSGTGLDDAIIACYAKMSAVIGERRGFKRRSQVTPSEFVLELERARLPGDALQRLTTLFERARYGDKSATQTEIDEAVDCLSRIVSSCMEAA
jgi:hypothetical protein